MTGRQSSAEEARGFGCLFVCLGGAVVCLMFVRLFRDAIPNEWRALIRSWGNQTKPPVEPWQMWTVAVGMLLMGWRMIVMAGRIERAERERLQTSEKHAAPPDAGADGATRHT